MNPSRFGQPCSQLLPSEVILRVQAPVRARREPSRPPAAADSLGRFTKFLARLLRTATDKRDAIAG